MRDTIEAAVRALLLPMIVALSGCGVGELGAAAAAGGASKAEEARQAEQVKDSVQNAIEDAQATARQAREAADSDP